MYIQFYSRPLQKWFKTPLGIAIPRLKTTGLDAKLGLTGMCDGSELVFFKSILCLKDHTIKVPLPSRLIVSKYCIMHFKIGLPACQPCFLGNHVYLEQRSSWLMLVYAYHWYRQNILVFKRFGHRVGISNETDCTGASSSNEEGNQLMPERNGNNDTVGMYIDWCCDSVICATCVFCPLSGFLRSVKVIVFIKNFGTKY